VWDKRDRVDNQGFALVDGQDGKPSNDLGKQPWGLIQDLRICTLTVKNKYAIFGFAQPIGCKDIS